MFNLDDVSQGLAFRRVVVVSKMVDHSNSSCYKWPLSRTFISRIRLPTNAYFKQIQHYRSLSIFVNATWLDVFVILNLILFSFAHTYLYRENTFNTCGSRGPFFFIMFSVTIAPFLRFSYLQFRSQHFQKYLNVYQWKPQTCAYGYWSIIVSRLKSTGYFFLPKSRSCFAQIRLLLNVMPFPFYFPLSCSH